MAASRKATAAPGPCLLDTQADRVLWVAPTGTLVEIDVDGKRAAGTDPSWLQLQATMNHATTQEK